MADPNIDKQLKAALDTADAAYGSAEDVLTNVTNSARTNTELERLTARSGWIALIFAQWAHSQEALVAGDADKAAKLDQSAQETVKSATQTIEGIVFPALPAKLRAAIPSPTPTAPATEPATAPATAPAAGEGSADEQAVRAVLVSFADAVDKGNLEAARPLCQIEPGQEQTFADSFKMASGAKKLRQSAIAKFADAARDLLKEVPDVPALCRTGKITIKGDDAFIEGVTTPGQKRGDLVRVGGQWKMLVEAPETEEQKKEAQMAPKLAAALATLSADLDAGKYATIQDFANALMQAIQRIGGG